MTQKNQTGSPFAKKYGKWLLLHRSCFLSFYGKELPFWESCRHLFFQLLLIVIDRLWIAIIDGSLLRHTSITLLEVMVGLLSGSLIATVLGYFLAKSRLLEKLLSPYLVASQAVPIVAIAPLLVIWFGPGIFSKIFDLRIDRFLSSAGEHSCGSACCARKLA